MEQTHEEEVMRITSQFIAEQEAGLRPRLEDYVRRYPQYVDEITDFVTYYYAVEVGLPTDTTSVPSLTAGSRVALNLAWERINTPLPAEAVTLETLARRRRYSLADLAARLDLSTDIVERLAGRQFAPTTIPHEVLQRLSALLGQSVGVVRQALGLPAGSSVSLVAETRVPYTVAAEDEQPGFRAAIVASSQLSRTQKDRWLTLLEREKL